MGLISTQSQSECFYKIQRVEQASDALIVSKTVFALYLWHHVILGVQLFLQYRRGQDALRSAPDLIRRALLNFVELVVHQIPNSVEEQHEVSDGAVRKLELYQ